MSYIVLLPVDGSNCAERAARHIADIANKLRGLQVHMLNVQPVGDDWMLRRKLKADELGKLEQEWGEVAIAPARAILESAGVAYTEHAAQGEVPQTIARLAQELSCDQIIMGTQGGTALGNVLLGSVASKVLHLSSVPVTLVK